MTYNIEVVPAKLVPFDWSVQGSSLSTATSVTSNATDTTSPSPSGQTMTQDESEIVNAILSANGTNIGYTTQATVATGPTGLSTAGGSIYPSNHPLYPLTLTAGLVFKYNPVISESLGIRYDVTELVHSNENIHAYKNTDNIRINLSECVWSSETFDEAVYTLGVIHFFRSYRLMDFGRKGPGSGRPPSPMWFSAYGAYAYNAIPVVLERVDFSFPSDVDYVGVPNPGSTSYIEETLQYSTSAQLNRGSLLNSQDEFTWIPIKFTVSSISLIVQNSIKYWTNEFSLADYKAGKMIGIR